MSLLNRDEIRRLEKAVKDKNKNKLRDWAFQFEEQLDNDMRKSYDEAFKLELQDAWDNLLIATAYALLFSEETTLSEDNLPSFMEDLLVTIDMYRTGEYKPQEYEDILKENGIVLDHYDYDRIYKKYLNNMNADLVDFVKNKRRKIITVIGSLNFLDDILEAYKKFTLLGNLVFIETINTNVDIIDISVIKSLNKDKILISDLVYVINKNGIIDKLTEDDISFAKEHNKQIEYLEPLTKEEGDTDG